MITNKRMIVEISKIRNEKTREKNPGAFRLKTKSSEQKFLRTFL